MEQYKEQKSRRSAQGLEDQKKKWLGATFKYFIFVPTTPGAELKQRMQKKGKADETRAGGREDWPIRIMEGTGKNIKRSVVNTDPFNGNHCNDKKCLPNKSEVSKINCRKQTIFVTK